MPQWGQSAQRPLLLLARLFDESESDSSLSQYAGADCRIAEPTQETPDFGESVGEGEAREMDLGSLFDSLPHPAELLGGDAEAELSPGVEAVVTGT